MLPPNVTVRAGESVRFNIRAQSHQVAIYAPGTRPDSISLTNLGGAQGTTGAGATIIDPIRRAGVSPALPFQQPMVPEWDWDTRGLVPGAYLVICTFNPHLDAGMTGTVVIQ
jgi:plastocyanin